MKRIQINYKPLDKAVTLSPINGSTVQQYNATIGEHVPDWSLVPLEIRPTVFIADPDGKIASGIKNAEFTDINWYENKVDASTLIASNNTSYFIDRDSADNNKGRIAVIRNVDSALTLIFTARYLDTRTNQGVPIQGSILLRAEEVVDVATVRLIPSYPFGKRLYILTGQTGLKISCPLMNGQDKVSGVVYKWYMKTDGDYSLIAEGGNGITGTATSELWIPVVAMKKRTTFKTEVTYEGSTYTEEHVLMLVYGDCNVEVIVPGDGDVSPTATSVTVRAEVSTSSGVIGNPEKYYDFDWYDQNGAKLGSGVALSIAASKFSAADFAVEVRATEKGSKKIWVADFSVNKTAMLSGQGTTGFLTLINMTGAAVFDIIFDSTSDGIYLFVHYGTYAIAYNITLSTIGFMKTQADSETSASWIANIEGISPGRHKVYVKCNTSKPDETGLIVEIDDIPVSDTFYLDYVPFEVKEKGRIEINGNAKLVSIGISSAVLSFEDTNTNFMTSGGAQTTLLPVGATLEELIKQI